MPNSNNSLEAFNCTLKEDGTFRKLLGAEKMLRQMKPFVELRSKMDVRYAQTVKIELHDWRVAQVAALMDGYFSTMGQSSTRRSSSARRNTPRSRRCAAAAGRRSSATGT